MRSRVDGKMKLKIAKTYIQHFVHKPFVRQVKSCKTEKGLDSHAFIQSEVKKKSFV